MNTQPNNPAQNQEQNSSVSFRIDKTKFEASRNQAPTVEWARISPNKVIVANSERAWLLEDTAQTASPNPATQYLNQSMSGSGSIATTRQLLDGAIAAAKYAVNSDVRPPALTVSRWVWRLASQYHLSYTYPLLIKEASQKFQQKGNFLLSSWAEEKVLEEKDHYLLALKDIQSLGYDANDTVKELFPPAAKVLVDYLHRSVYDENPIDCVGYSYVMERLALGVSKDYIRDVEALFPSNIKATRCLQAHSSVGADTKHVEETATMISELSSNERVRITRACYETALICFSPDHKGYMTDKTLNPILDKVKSNKSC
ncbi:MAG: hypothetical protein AAGF83_26170 [Cyanobacteria bacterium P01_G01_bin.67]